MVVSHFLRWVHTARVAERAAAAAGLASGLVHDDARPPLRETHRGGESRKPGADHVNRVRHQMKA